MNCVIAGLVAGVGAFVADYVMWTKVFMKGMESFATPRSAEEMKKVMATNLPRSAILSLVFGVLLAWFYGRLKGALWASPGPLAGMEFATLLWAPTIALATIGSGVWYDKVRPLLRGMFWSWLVRMNVAGLIVGAMIH